MVTCAWAGVRLISSHKLTRHAVQERPQQDAGQAPEVGGGGDSVASHPQGGAHAARARVLLRGAGGSAAPGPDRALRGAVDLQGGGGTQGAVHCPAHW